MADDAVAAHERARSTELALQRHHLDRDRHLFGSRRPQSGWRYEPLWAYATAWSASATLAALRDPADPTDPPEAWMAGLARYARGGTLGDPGGPGPVGLESRVTPPLGTGGDRFYDDNAWIGLALYRHHRLHGAPELLGRARQVLAFVLSGWSDEPGWAHPGGIRWKEPAGRNGRNTCANGPAAELAAELAIELGDQGLLDRAERIYGWVRAALLLESGLYGDHLAPEGTMDETIWSYNQGTMIGAGALLFGATGRGHYLDHAEESAAAVLARYPSGPALADQPPVFNAVLLRNLLVLDGERPDPAYRSLAEAWAEEIWTNRRTPGGLVAAEGSVVNATAPLVEVEALLAGAPALP